MAGAEDRGDEGDRRFRHALRAEAVRHDDRRRLRRADGRGDGDVPDDEGVTRQDERRGRQDRRHADPDHDDHGRGEVGRPDRAGAEGRQL